MTALEIDPIILTIASLTFFVGGLAKGALGFGLPLIAIPMITAFGSLPMALSIAVPPAIATNLWQIWKFRDHRKVSFLPSFLLFGAGGLFFGVLLLKNIQNAYLEVGLGCLVFFYLWRSRKATRSLPAELSNKIAPVMGGLAGMVHGSVGLSGIVGPPFFHAAGLARDPFIYCSSAIFIMFALLHLPAMAMVGLFDRSAILIGVLVIAPVFVGLWIGNRVGEKLNAATFLVLVKGLLAIAAISPIWNGLSELFFAT